MGLVMGLVRGSRGLALGLASSAWIFINTIIGHFHSSSYRQYPYRNNPNIKITTIEKKMPKPRPLSSKPITTIPILIDETENSPDYEPKNSQCLASRLKPKLSQIVPELPQFGIKSNSTALLYSKFIVKGLKEDKIGLVRGAFRKKEEITEAATLDRDKNRTRNKSIRSTTRLKTGEIADTFAIEDENPSIFGNQKDHTGMLLRASSAKVFRKTANNYALPGQETSERTLIKNKTEANLGRDETRRRPTTAKPSRNKDVRFSHQQQQHKAQSKQAKKQRPTTASNTRQNPIPSLNDKSLNWPEQLTNLLSTKLKDKPLRIEALKGIDHIERNIQNISSYTRKTSSIYLTNANLDQLLNNRKQETKPVEQKKEEEKKEADENQPRPQQLFTKIDRAKQEGKLREVQSYLEQALPNKFQLVSQEIRKQQKRNNTEISENYQELLSKGLGPEIEDESENPSGLDDRSAKACFEDYIQNCQILQYNISSKLKTQQSNSNPNPTLTITQCQQLIQLYQSLSSTPRSSQAHSSLIDQIRELTQTLKYFSHKPKQQVHKFFTIPFQILIVDEDYQIIELNSPVSHIYVILNGSVLVETNTGSEGDLGYGGGLEGKLFNSQFSLYDGEVFGEPAKPSEKFYKMRVTTLEQSLLLKIKYQDYISKFFQGSEVEEKIEMLKLTFKMEINRGLLKEEDLEILSLSLEKHRFPSKSLIFRQGEMFDKLVLVARGKVACISELILDQDRIHSSDMKQLDKKIKESKQRQPKSLNSELDPDKLQISKMRRQNLINHEILRQDPRKLYYYFQKEHVEYVRGDSINWQPLFTSFVAPVAQNQLQEALSAIFQFGLMSALKPVNFGLMSNSDQTEVYFLSKTSFQYLPSNIKKVLLAKAEKQKANPPPIQSEKQIKEWNNYKQKLCNDIIKDRKSSRKL